MRRIVDGGEVKGANTSDQTKTWVASQRKSKETALKNIKGNFSAFSFERNLIIY